ncbi:hypothetical protein TNCV_615401, partial [Trichonephila clavipes]
MQVIRRSDIGKRPSQIGAALNLAVATTTSSATSIISRTGNSIEEMEKRLSIWIDDEIER